MCCAIKTGGKEEMRRERKKRSYLSERPVTV
jgi:hypothetical protein